MKPIQIEVFASPGCNRCGQALDLVDKITREIGTERFAWRKVDVLDELDYAVELGVLSMPAIVINGELVFRRRPTADILRDELKSRLQDLP